MQTRSSLSRFLSLLLLCALLLSALPGSTAQAAVTASCEGGVSSLSLVGTLSHGKDALFKLQLRQAGSVQASLVDVTNSKSLSLLSKTCPAKTPIAVSIPGDKLSNHTAYRLEVRLLSGSQQTGFASVSFQFGSSPLSVSDFTVSPSVSPSTADVLSIRFTLSAPARVTAIVRNASGRHIRTVKNAVAFPAGANQILWNGVVGDGSCVPWGKGYTLSLYAEDASTRTATLSASFDVNGSSHTAVAAKVTGVLTQAALTRLPKAGESVWLYFHTEAAGSYSLQLKDTASGRKATLSGKAKAGKSRVQLPGSLFVEGHTTQLQFSLKGGRGGTARMDIDVAVPKPSLHDVIVPASLAAGYGASLPISYRLTGFSKVTTQILSTSGRIMTTAESSISRASGTHTVYWNGRDVAGKYLPNGTYVIRVQAVNSSGAVTATSSSFTYTGAASGIETPTAEGAIRQFASLQSPTLPERTPAQMVVVAKQSGTLTVSMARPNSKMNPLLTQFITSGDTVVTIPGNKLLSGKWIIEATLRSGNKIIGKARATIAPQKVAVGISSFVCNGQVSDKWVPAISGSYETASAGTQMVSIQNSAGKTVCVMDNTYAAAGTQIFYWDGTDGKSNRLPDGTYTALVSYVDDYGEKSSVLKSTFSLSLPPLPKGVYGYTVVGKGSFKTPIPIYDRPEGTSIRVTYPITAQFKVLAEQGSWLYVEASCMTGSPQRGYVMASAVEKIAITSPYRIEVCLSRSGSRAQRMWVYKDNKVIDTFKVSTGLADGSTGNGSYVILNRKPSAMDGMLMHVMRVCGGVAIHRVPLIDGTYAGTSAKLGRPASHGCIRVPVDKSEWLYKNIPDTTPVITFYD